MRVESRVIIEYKLTGTKEEVVRQAERIVKEYPDASFSVPVTTLSNEWQVRGERPYGIETVSEEG